MSSSTNRTIAVCMSWEHNLPENVENTCCYEHKVITELPWAGSSRAPVEGRIMTAEGRQNGQRE